jgi:hypothetical protein
LRARQAQIVNKADHELLTGGEKLNHFNETGAPRFSALLRSV